MASSLDPREFVRVLAPAMAQAAAIAAALEGRVPNVPKPGARSAVKAALTIADTASQEALLVPLLAGFTAARLEAEEDTRSVAMFRGDDADARIVIDPIDGTLHYYLGAQGPYAVMAGIAFGGRYAASLVAMPREGWLFQAVRGDGARRTRIGAEARTATGVLGQNPGDRATLSREGARVLLSDGVPEAAAGRLAASGFETQRACGGAVAVAPLVPGVRGGLRVTKPSQSTISTRGRIGLLIAAEAGAVIESAHGAPFPDALDAPASALVVASDAEIAAALRAALEA
jgi:fructose-1,6-bisphosphatase/inositol monophosphatase family enzyme